MNICLIFVPGGVEQRQLVGLISRRSQVRILPFATTTFLLMEGSFQVNFNSCYGLEGGRDDLLSYLFLKIASLTLSPMWYCDISSSSDTAYTS